MGEQADYILNGDDCQECGQYIGNGNGFPRTGNCCKPQQPKKKKKGKSEKLQAFKDLLKKRDILYKSFNSGIHIQINSHWNFYPTTGKWYNSETGEKGVFKSPEQALEMIGHVDSPEIKFYSMDRRPPYSEDDPSFSKAVMVYDDTLKEVHSEIGYFDFSEDEWCHFGDASMRLICWCYIPDPRDFIKNNDLKHVTHRGYRD